MTDAKRRGGWLPSTYLTSRGLRKHLVEMGVCACVCVCVRVLYGFVGLRWIKVVSITTLMVYLMSYDVLWCCFWWFIMFLKMLYDMHNTTIYHYISSINVSEHLWGPLAKGPRNEGLWWKDLEMEAFGSVGYIYIYVHIHYNGHIFTYPPNKRQVSVISTSPWFGFSCWCISP